MSYQKTTIAIQHILIVIGAYLSGYYFTGLFHGPTSFIGGLWAVISGIIVIESSHIDTWQSAKKRIIGTFIGVVISGAYLFFFDFSILGYGICIALGVLICYLVNAPQSIKLSGITISVVLIVSTIEKELHPFANAGLRFAESAIGTGIALLAAFITYYLDKTNSRQK